jgi:MFS family permease
MAVVAAYRRILSNGPLARLLIGEFVSSIGDWLYLVAMLVLVWGETNGDALTLGIIGAARILPYVLLSVPAGIVADRFDRRLVLLTTDVARGLIMLVIAAAVVIHAPVLLIVGLAVLATCFSAFFAPTIGAYVPSLVRDESELGPANSAWSSLENLAFFIGPAVGAVLLQLGSLEIAFVLNALTFAIVALVLLWLPPSRAGATAEVLGSAPAPATRAARTHLRATLGPLARPLVGLGLLDAVDNFIFGGLGVITVILAVEVFGTGDAGTGLLNSAVGVGGIIGALLAGVLILRRRLGPPLILGAVAFGAGVAALGQIGSFAGAFALALVAIAIAAAGALLTETVATTLLQRMVPDLARGRVLGVIQTTSVSAYAAGSFLVPVIGATSSALVPLLLALGAAMAAAGVVAVLLLGRFAIQEPVVDPAARRLGQVTLFAGLPPARLEAAMAAAVVRPMAAGEVVIRQGDVADLFFLIAQGRVEVSQTAADGSTRVLRQMGEGEFFGEIGLLSGVPRTATVTALTDGRLVALPKREFLELVSAGQGLTYRLLDLHRGAVGVSSEAPTANASAAPAG